MMLWLGLALLTAAVLVLLLRPLLLPAESASAAEADLAVYRDQLSELESEHRRGLIAEAEAGAAKVEIARRLLASAASPSPASTPGATSRIVRIAPLALCLALPALAIGLYLSLGSPGLPGYPLAARLSAPVQTTDVAALIAKVEARLRQHPDDGQGWDVIAPVYLRQGRYQEAATAFANAASLLGQSVQRLAGFAEATVLASDGIVTEPAREAYQKLAKLEPTRIEPRFWLALAAEQDGQLAAAAEAYAALLREGDGEAPWRKAVSARLEAVRARLGSQSTGSEQASSATAPGPSAEDVAAAAQLSPQARAEFIDGMVTKLADRLRNGGGDLESWQRLIRAYNVLGRNSEAVAALADARRNLAGEPKSLQQLDALAKSLGLES
jgi:cytochrome c-type biogenesis protein CcmH